MAQITRFPPRDSDAILVFDSPGGRVGISYDDILHCVQLAVVHARFPKLPAEWADDVIAADRQVPGAIDRQGKADP